VTKSFFAQEAAKLLAQILNSTFDSVPYHFTLLFTALLSI